VGWFLWCPTVSSLVGVNPHFVEYLSLDSAWVVVVVGGGGGGGGGSDALAG